MYDFHYNFIKKSLMLNCCLLTQTVLRVKSKDVCENFFKQKQLLDFRNVLKDTKFYDNQN